MRIGEIERMGEREIPSSVRNRWTWLHSSAGHRTPRPLHARCGGPRQTVTDCPDLRSAGIVTMTRRQGLPHTFGWLLLVRSRSADGSEPMDLWETPTGEQYWLTPGARLEREGHDYTVL
jgi:hypothetical protein